MSTNYDDKLIIELLPSNLNLRFPIKGKHKMTSNSRAVIIEPDMARQKLCGNPSRLQHHGPRQPVDITLVKISIIFFQSITLSEVLLSYCQKQILFVRFLFWFFESPAAGPVIG